VSYFGRAVLLFSVVFSVGILFAQTQNAQKPNASATGLLGRALSAVSGGTPIHDVAQTGRVRRIAGSTDETGQAELKALVSGEARIDLSFPSGPFSEVYARGQRGPVGEWSGADGKLHAMASHNLLVDAAWFSPALILERAAATGKIVTAAGTTNSGGHPLDHLRVVSPPPSAPSQASPRLPQTVLDALQKAAQFDLYLDSATSLPVEMDFQTHPDNNLGQDIPVRIRYSDYRAVNGVQVPFHVRKYLNNTLYLDLQFDAASFNTGLAANSFVVTAQPSRSLPQ
jgi:hypothetical protein